MLLFSCKVRYIRWLKYLQVSQCGGFVGLRLALGLCLTCLLLFVLAQVVFCFESGNTCLELLDGHLETYDACFELLVHHDLRICTSLFVGWCHRLGLEVFLAVEDKTLSVLTNISPVMGSPVRLVSDRLLDRMVIPELLLLLMVTSIVLPIIVSYSRFIRRLTSWKNRNSMSRSSASAMRPISLLLLQPLFCYCSRCF